MTKVVNALVHDPMAKSVFGCHRQLVGHVAHAEAPGQDDFAVLDDGDRHVPALPSP